MIFCVENTRRSIVEGWLSAGELLAPLAENAWLYFWTTLALKLEIRGSR
jgi:hypothetical protein